ncbi:MAG: hypothetical protein M3Y57_08530 [Acidobacteriota bacterium]|nr:hypothetical protein [Acidobacteriota bacterium]
MMPDVCEYEDTVMAALATGHAPAEIQRHLKTCETCREAQLVWRYLETVASQEAGAGAVGGKEKTGGAFGGGD